MDYRLSQILTNNSDHVHTIAESDSNSIVTAALDGVVIVWERKGFRDSYVLRRVLDANNSGIVSCVTLPPNQAYPTGIIIIGAMDNTVRIYNGNDVAPFRIMSRLAVTAFCAIGNVMFSVGTWTGKIQVWNVVDAHPILRFRSHRSLITAILYIQESNLIITSSSNTVMHGHNFTEVPELKLRFIGHEDFIRDLASVGNESFVSCSDDGTIRRWDTNTGDQLQLVYFNDKSLFCIATKIDSNMIVCAGDGNRITIFRDFVENNVLLIPAEKIWAIIILDNEDIIVSASDLKLYVFTKDKNRYCSNRMMSDFHRNLIDFDISTAETIIID